MCVVNEKFVAKLRQHQYICKKTVLQINKTLTRSQDCQKEYSEFYDKKFAQSTLYSYLCTTKLVTHSDEPGF